MDDDESGELDNEVEEEDEKSTEEEHEAESKKIDEEGEAENVSFLKQPFFTSYMQVLQLTNLTILYIYIHELCR